MRASADPHLAPVRDDVPQMPGGCTECLQVGSPPAHLRPCLTCGHLGGRDSPPLRAAPVAARPIVRSFEPGEPQRWCHADEPYV
jgi:hypothetical protein